MRASGRGMLVLAVGLALGDRAAAFDADDAACLLEVAAEKAARTDARLDPGAYPKSTGAGGRWTTVSAGDRVGWTQGFFPGVLWSLARATGEARWRDLAVAWTRPLAVQRSNRETHDLGFKLMPSFGELAEIGDAAARQVLLDAAASLASRFDGRIGAGAVSCCDWNPDWSFPVVVDTMVNLELLFWSSANGGPPEHARMARAHALTSIEWLMRPDGSTFHVVDFDAATGALRSRGTFQGQSAASTWSRGQAWMLYGLAVAYRYTGDARILEASGRAADYWLAHVGSDGVPNWDFDSARAQKDSSAGAAAAAALLDLASQHGGARQASYGEAARRALDALVSDAYLDRGASEAVLRHGVGDLPRGREVDVGLAYGDHYALEAALRATAGVVGQCAAGAGGGGGTPGGGGAGGGGGTGGAPGGAPGGGGDPGGGVPGGGLPGGGVPGGGIPGGGIPGGSGTGDVPPGAGGGAGDGGAGGGGGAQGAASGGGSSGGGCSTGGGGAAALLLAAAALRRVVQRPRAGLMSGSRLA